jgi:Fe-S-cluster containining protein
VTTAAPRSLPLRDSPPLAADGAFSYECRRCLRCCRDKRIAVNPYEVYRLARRVGASTTDFIARFTVEGGTELARRPDGRCVFLGDEGCTVHPDRPLVCRLYPLGRRVRLGEPDTFVQIEGDPDSAGELGDAGTVAGYLDAQGARPFMDAADRYLETLATLAESLALLEPSEGAPCDDALASPWLDVHAVLAARGGPLPSTADEAMDAHRASLLEWGRALLTPRHLP